MTPQAHVIGRQVLELDFGSERDVFFLQQEIVEIFRTNIVPAMEEVFDRYAPSDVVLRLDRLDIDLGRLPRDRLDEAFTTKVCEALEVELAAHVPEDLAQDAKKGRVRLSHDSHVLDLWYHVLLHGHLPWWAGPASAATLEARVLETLRSRDALPASTARLLREHRVAIERIAVQGNEALLERLIHLAADDVAAASIPAFESLCHSIELQSIEGLRLESLRRRFWQALLEEGVCPTATDPQARLQALFRSALEMTARDTSMPFLELLSQLRAVASSSTPGIRAEGMGAALGSLSPQGGEGNRLVPKKGNGDALQTRPKSELEASDHSGDSMAASRGGQRPAPGHRVLPPEARDRNPRNRDDSLRAERDALIGEQTRPIVTKSDAIFVDDAGVALLHPFLATHFEKLGLQRNGVFLDGDTRERAVHQLRFLAMGEEQVPEPLLVFEKILCGLSPDFPIGRSLPLASTAKSEADILLRAVIRHWGALKNATPSGLRETFLRREGRLEHKQDGWKIRVEARSYDLLLDRLPWSMGVVRLPWMADVLFVEWG